MFPVRGIPHPTATSSAIRAAAGRVHEGQDLPAGCGRLWVAARGRKVAATGYSDALYGYWILIDGLATDHDYFYAHLQAHDPPG